MVRENFLNEIEISGEPKNWKRINQNLKMFVWESEAQMQSTPAGKEEAKS